MPDAARPGRRSRGPSRPDAVTVTGIDATVRAVAPLLEHGGWSVADAETSPTGAKTPSWVLAGPDGARIQITSRHSESGSSRIRVAGLPPHDVDPTWDVALRQSITLDAARPAARVAADITRRLIADYRAALPQARERTRRAADQHQAEDRLFATVRRILQTLGPVVELTNPDRLAVGDGIHGPFSILVDRPHLFHERPDVTDHPVQFGEVRMSVHPRQLPRLVLTLALMVLRSATADPAVRFPAVLTDSGATVEPAAPGWTHAVAGDVSDDPVASGVPVLAAQARAALLAAMAVARRSERAALDWAGSNSEILRGTPRETEYQILTDDLREVSTTIRSIAAGHADHDDGAMLAAADQIDTDTGFA